jgi:hypothetical protein
MGNEPIESNGIKFDSKGELKVWHFLEARKGILQIGRPYKVTLLPKTSNFGERYMDVDFWMGFDSANPLFLIEYKGDWVLNQKSNLSLLKTRLHLMEVHNPSAFARLLIVGSQELDLPNMITLNDLDKKLKGIS